MDHKTFAQVSIKDEAKGQVTALFATLNAIDMDGDVTLPGAFPDGKEVVVSAYNHGSWEGALPVGHGRIRETRDAALLDAQFLMDTTHGRDAFLTVKALAKRNLGEWSYGYKVNDSYPGTFDGEDVRYLKALDVFEVSPVLRGAGVGTHTVDAKGSTVGDHGTQHVTLGVPLRRHETKTSRAPWDAAGALAVLADGDDRIGALRAAYGWVDPSGDPGAKASYRVLHHDVTGAANIRACLVEIAALNGAGKGSTIPADQRKAVYEHLAGHLEDDDFDVPDLGDGRRGGIKFADELFSALAAVDSVLSRSADVVAMRTRKGKGLASASVLALEWLIEDMRKARTLLDTPQEDAARELTRFIGQRNGMI